MSVIIDELEQANYKVLSDINDPFYKIKKNKADFLLGATLTDVKRNSCVSGKTQTGEAYVRIEWSLLDVEANTVTYKGTTEGWTNTKVEDTDYTKNLAYNAFRESLRSLLADKKFVATVKN